MLHDKIIQHDGNEQATKWPRYLIYALGASFGILFLLYALIAIATTPRQFPFLGTHVGFFISDKTAAIILFFALFLVYVAFFVFIASHGRIKRKFKFIILMSVLFVAFLIIAPPFLSADLYGYIFRAEIVTVHNVNPYHIAPADLGYGNIMPSPHLPMTYGPLYTVISMVLQKISGPMLFVNMLVFRLFNVLLFAGCAFLIYHIVKLVAPRFSHAATALFLWNPFILIEVVNNGHNDIMMLLCILASVYAIIRKKWIAAGIFLGLGMLIKFMTVILFPILFILILKQKGTVWRKITQIILVLVIVSSIAAILYIPFDTFISNVTNLNRAYFESNKLTFPKAFVSAGAEYFSDMLNREKLSQSGLQIVYLIVFLIGYIVLLFFPKISRGDNFIKRYFWVLLLALCFIGNVYNIWYTIWLFPLVLLVADVKYRPLILFFTLSGFVFYIDNNLFANTLLVMLLLLYYSYIKGAEYFRR